MKTIPIAIVDDHTLISKALENMITENTQYRVIMNHPNGEEFIAGVEQASELPAVVLMDVNMPYKNGIETTEWLTEHYPDIKVIALTMDDDERILIKMLKAGAKGYLLKDMQPSILFQAIETVYEKGSFYTDFVAQKLLKVKTEEAKNASLLSELRDREKEFIKWACSELTYKEIADKMCLSPKTIDGYRDSVFVKLDIKNRAGLVLFALKHDLC
ncbi:DNA-binding NarL/FixJ family response regulator [Chryseobacterium bernardetii]|uniref:LuxR family two component transcriptional regulator n=3 Tax=Chryseobacterium TaxID=59732 RepID=A0A543EBP0_9FLAO|nr:MULTISPECIES: response regulator transcription factor [Chryseobacterium]MDR6371407.1 DNA-binding NarL/FixJ family response regulator [Chryseobacterium vietnamense]MDR6442088.1 DNA-binding NarL/FixJ family response regulator [Chryseobacterium bernardetii]MDR6459896.1 DNA-binding NarL/FixJ family response regulator [Chryseobacterium vietnamense]MDR6488070.1 DNA-binding NarL/FixJ family response regulator [Chryseobacterium vietnamense]TQM18966.1 LuxR family two component transcriptional regula